MPIHHFRSGTFKSLLWINGGDLFYDPNLVNVEFATAGAYMFRVADAEGKVKLDIEHDNAHAGWTSFHLPSWGIHGGDYKLGFVNAAEGVVQKIKWGDVTCA